MVISSVRHDRAFISDKVLELKLHCCHRQLSSFPLATRSSLAISRISLPMTSKAAKLSLETEPVAYDNNTR